MPFNRTRLCVAIGLFAIFGASPTFGQGPLGMQLFGPADTSTFGGGQPPNEGYFGSVDVLYWSVQRPNTVPIGAAGSLPKANSVTTITNPDGTTTYELGQYVQTSTMSTGPLLNDFQVGQRFEFGRVEDNRGWMVSIYRLQGDDQIFTGQNSGVLFTDSFGLLVGKVGTYDKIVLQANPTPPPATILVDQGEIAVNGDLPVTFGTISATNHIDTWGVEASYLMRSHTFHSGGNVEFFLGARYLEFNEEFNVNTTGGLLDAGTFWNTAAGNHIVGPQIGARYFKQQGRWMFSTEGRFLAGYNSQNICQEGNFGYSGATGAVLTPLAWPGASFESRTTIHEFSPLVELRVDFRYVITRAVSLRAGFTGMWMDGIARPSGLISYKVPNMGIDPTANRQNVLMTGANIGIEINR